MRNESNLNMYEGAPKLATLDSYLYARPNPHPHPRPHPRPHHRYEGAPKLATLDSYLYAHGFRRQYCEWNRWMWRFREMNCLYANRALGGTWLWATGNSRKADSMVSYAQHMPPFVDLVRHLLTSNFTGERLHERARDGRTHRLGSA